jgi:acetolactate synthase I/II/III large subunit
MRTAELVVSLLRDAGIRRIYGWAGDGSGLDLVEAARTRDIALVAPRLLASAAIMAGTEGDLLDRPGVCVVPGQAWAALAGLAHAYSGRNPLVLFFSRAARGLRGPDEDHFEETLRGLTKGGGEITAPRAERLARWAWKRANSTPKGPVSLAIPTDRSLQPARYRRQGLRPAEAVKPSPSGVQRVARVLGRAGRTLVVAGMGCRDAEASAALLDLAEHLGAPVFTTRRAKGVVPEDHPLSAGVFMGSRWEQQLFDRADSVLTVGLDPAGVIPAPWRPELPVLSLQDTSSRQPFRARAAVRGDLRQAMIQLRGELPPAGEWRLAEWAQRAAGFKGRTRALLAGTGRAGLSPHRVVAIARAVFPRDTIATVDSGAHALAVATFWDAFDAKGFLAPVSGGTGSALPAAIAAKLTRPERPVLAFLGEGGLFASLGEIATASELGLPIVAVVFLDESFSLVRALQEQRHYAPVGVSPGPTRLPELAEHLGALGIQVETEAEFGLALQEALAAPRPALIGARINPHGYRRLIEVLSDTRAPVTP